MHDHRPFEFVTDEVLGVEFSSALLARRHTLPQSGYDPTPKEVSPRVVPRRGKGRPRSGPVEAVSLETVPIPF